MDIDKIQRLLQSRISLSLELEDTGGVKDEAGNSLTLTKVDGKVFPNFGEETVRNVGRTKVRDDDVILLGYPKTGAHWLVQILSRSLNGKTPMETMMKFCGFMEAVPLEVVELLPSPRVLNTHVMFEDFPEEIKNRTVKPKFVLTRRNPKDTVVSFFNHVKKLPFLYKYEGNFNNYFKLFAEGQVDYGSYFDYYAFWEKFMADNPDIDILLVDYEDLKEDLLSGVRRIVQFLGLNRTEEEIEEIAKSAGLDAMKEAGKNSQMAWIRKGMVGDWKNWLTVAQSEILDEMFKAKMPGCHYKPKYTLCPLELSKMYIDSIHA